MRLQYHLNMSKDEERMFMRELAMLDNAYEQAAKMDKPSRGEDEMEILRKAALNHRGQP